MKTGTNDVFKPIILYLFNREILVLKSIF